MADISITPANVLKVAGNTTAGTAGETITAGQTCYLKSTDSKFWLADVDAAAVSGQTGINIVRGIALHSASANQPLTLQIDGTITIGATVVEGLVQYQSPIAGGITETILDIVSTTWITIIGVAISASVIEINLNKYDAQGQ